MDCIYPATHALCFALLNELFSTCFTHDNILYLLALSQLVVLGSGLVTKQRKDWRLHQAVSAQYPLGPSWKKRFEIAVRWFKNFWNPCWLHCFKTNPYYDLTRFALYSSFDKGILLLFLDKFKWMANSKRYHSEILLCVARETFNEMSKSRRRILRAALQKN